MNKANNLKLLVVVLRMVVCALQGAYLAQIYALKIAS